MTHQLKPTTWHAVKDVLMPRQPNKDEQSRLLAYIDWLSMTRRSWLQPDLAEYRDYLLHERIRMNPRTGAEEDATLAPSTVQAHLATIRGRYNTLMRDNRFRDSLYELAPRDAGPADRKAFVDELMARLQNAVHPTTAQVATITVQDAADSEYVRLKPDQVKALLRAPGVDTLIGMRDTAMFAMMVCTGIREAELVALNLDDLRQSLGGEVAVRVRSGKGRKQRMVPYGPLDWCLVYVDRWLDMGQITSGPVFRGVYKGGKRVRPTRLTERTVNRAMNAYPVMIDGTLRDVKPHDLRRTYARNAYERGMDLERIRQNLGHVSLQTTQTYIGTLDAPQRRPPPMFAPPHNLAVLAQRWQPDEG